VDWTAGPAAPDRIRLGQVFVCNAPTLGLSRANLTKSSEEAFGDGKRWMVLFPRGLTEVIWLISEVSDASMCAAFSFGPAPDIASVIQIRFDQNAALKPFVRRVMEYDIMHPVQALARMQRTARAMYGCLSEARTKPGAGGLTILNLVYTGLVFLWLLDRTAGDRLTRAATHIATRRM
jgi:hypothetical protein